MKTSSHHKFMRKEGFIVEVAELWPMAKGSLAEVRKPCIRVSCPVCKRGERHPSFIFSFMEGGRRKCMHVPRELVPRLRQAILNGRRMEKRMVQIGYEMIREYRRLRDVRRSGEGET